VSWNTNELEYKRVHAELVSLQGTGPQNKPQRQRLKQRLHQLNPVGPSHYASKPASQTPRQAASVTVRVSTLGGTSTNIPVLRTATVSELMDEYARQTGKAHFDLATCKRVLDERELLSDILLETAETSKDTL
jgi:hypothetical protein